MVERVSREGGRCYFGSGTALQLGFDLPGEVGATVLFEDDVVAFGVEVFGVDEETVHVEETGADFRKSRNCRSTREDREVEWGSHYSGLAMIMMAVLCRSW